MWRKIDNDSAGTRLDLVLVRALPGFSRSRVRELLRSGRVRVDGVVVRTGRRLGPGEQVEVEVEVESSGPPPLAAPELPLDVVFENSALIVVDKPAGMPTHPLSPEERHTLANALVARYPELRGIGDRPLEAGLLHRLDNDTSGLLCAARTQVAWNAFQAQFEGGEVKKGYLALVHGRPLFDELTVTAAIGHDRAQRERMRVDPAGRSAETRVTVLRRWQGRALVEAVITKGARHQIRVHLASIGHPIVGDRLYGDPQQPRPAERHFLHAAWIELAHPVSGERVRFEAGLPAELVSWMEYSE